MKVGKYKMRMYAMWHVPHLLQEAVDKLPNEPNLHL